MGNVTSKTLKKHTLGMIMAIAFVLLFGMVTNVQAATVKLNKTSKQMVIDSTYRLKVSGTSKKVHWSSTNERVADVDDRGVVYANEKGTATIKAKVGTKTLRCKITVITLQSSYETKVKNAINLERRKCGRVSVKTNSYLQKAAQTRAKQLSSRYSHKTPEGYNWTAAISLKYDYVASPSPAELIACDFSDPEELVAQFMNNSGTRKSIRVKNYNEIGVGTYLGDDGYLYCCVILAKRNK